MSILHVFMDEAVFDTDDPMDIPLPNLAPLGTWLFDNRSGHWWVIKNMPLLMTGSTVKHEHRWVIAHEDEIPKELKLKLLLIN